MLNIPLPRLILYVMIIGGLPVFFAFANLLSKMNAVDTVENHLLHIQQLALVQERKQSLNMIVRKHFKDSDHFYIDKYLESLSFLKPEAETLQKLVHNKYFAGDETVKRRLEFITGPNNSLLFSEGNVQAYPFFQEITDNLVHPVEINVDDLKEILAIVEGESIGTYRPGPKRPQLMIIDFKLDKKEITDHNEVFLLNMKVIRREYS